MTNVLVEKSAMARKAYELIRVEQALAFLHITWMVGESDDSISTKVFRKDTHTNQYMNFISNYSLKYKRGVVQTLVNKVDRLVSVDTELGRDKKHTRKTLHVNSYLH